MDITRRAAVSLIPGLAPASHHRKEPPVGNGWSNQKITELTIPTDATTGERITINVGQDGAILVYNSDGKLIDAIASSLGTAADGTQYVTGLSTYQPDSNVSSFLNGADLFFFDGTAFSSTASAGIQFQTDPAGAGYLSVSQDVTGAMVQNDDTTGNAPKAMHTGLFSATVSGAAGLATFNHGAAFTPTFGLFTPLTNFSQGNITNAFGTHGFTRTQSQITAFGPTGTFVSNGTTVTFYAMFMA